MDLLIVACSPQGAQQLKLDEEVRELQQVRPISSETLRRPLPILTAPPLLTMQAMLVSRNLDETSPDEVMGLLEKVNTKRFIFCGHGNVCLTGPQPMHACSHALS